MTELPDGWEYKTLGEVAKWGSGGTPRAGTKTFYDGEIPWAIIGDLNDSYVSQAARNITKKGLEESSAKMVPVGSVLIAMYGSIGKLGINTIPMATNQAIAFAIPRKDLVLQKYLFYYLRSQREVFLRSGKGATQQNISQTLLKSWKIPIPPLPEQQMIVEILEDNLCRLDATLADVKLTKLKAEQFRRSLLKSAFSGYLSGDLSSIKKISFDKVFQVGKTAGKSVKQKEYLIEGKYPVIDQGDDFISGYSNDASLLLDFKVPIVIFGDHTRRFKYVNFPFTPGADGTKVLIPDEALNSKFAYYQLLSKELRDRGYARHFSELRKEMFWVPPQETQSQIVEILEDHLSRLDASVAVVEVMEKQSSSLRLSLLQAAFSGKLTKEVASV